MVEANLYLCLQTNQTNEEALGRSWEYKMNNNNNNNNNNKGAR